MNTCEHCRHWTEEPNEIMKYVGECSSPKLNPLRGEEEPDSFFSANEASYSGGSFVPCRSFGCIHWEPKGLQV